ncbi:MAG TPA: TOBE domain-containing protein [Lachnospiraceae bacterium]|nr:TOBE domain-containing protein [Lachnospiraceae bacterium]
MTISARNKIAGSVASIKEGVVNASVIIETANGDKISSTITKESAKELGLAVGKEAIAVVKASEVMIGIGEMKISARNQIDCTVTDITEGMVNALVSLTAEGGSCLSSNISMAAVKELGIEKGSKVKAVIKATSVMVSV